jgi:osmotically-inducible protein OsmY
MKALLLAALSITVTAQGVATAQEAAADATAAAPAATTPKDPKTAAREVEQALKRSEGVPKQGLAVSTHADTVILTGEVKTDAEAARAQSVAEIIAEPLRVSSQIQVRPDERSTAGQGATVKLVSDVEAALKRDQRTANLGVSVSIDDKQVIGLHGLVPSRASRTAAEDVAGRVAGVKQVRSHLVVPGE